MDKEKNKLDLEKLDERMDEMSEDTLLESLKNSSE